MSLHGDLGFIKLTKMVQTALLIRSNYKAEKCPLCEDTGSQEVTAALYKDIIGFLADALCRKVTCSVRPHVTLRRKAQGPLRKR